MPKKHPPLHRALRLVDGFDLLMLLSVRGRALRCAEFEGECA